MAKLYARAFAQTPYLAFISLIAFSTACAWTSDDRYAQGVVACSDAQSCDAMWRAATNWIAKNSPLALAERTDSLLETRCSSRAETLACYTVTRQPRRSGENRINIYIACGNDFVGCAQPATKLRNQLTAVMASASPSPSPSLTESGAAYVR